MELYREGSKGAIVKSIQKVVGAFPDGIWGRLTTQCVKEWQKAHNLTADGIVGPATLSKMGLSALMPKSSENQESTWLGNIQLKKSKRSITHLVVHCTATREGQDLTVEQIRKDHRAQGWSDIGYHYIIYRDGTVNLGRDVNIAGAHVANHNATTIGIAYVGGLENIKGVPYNKLPSKDTRTKEQKEALLSLLIALKRLYPAAKICGHRDFSEDKNKNGVIDPPERIKDCPCFDAIPEYKFL
jgi:N-acetyl-anhydromuramyl-L-alanine amidase AmpD